MLQRRLYSPAPVEVRIDAADAPAAVDGVAVEALRERWVVDDRWWVPRAWLHREYFELVLADGRAVVVFRSLQSKSWFRQRA